MSLDLAAIKARHAKATTGDQLRNGRRWMARELGKRYQVCTRDLRHVVFADSWDDANFIAHARTDIPALVAEVERLRGIEAAAKAVDASWAESWDCSAHPQHGKHFEAIGNLNAALRAAGSGE